MCPYLKATPQRKNQMQRRSTFEVIIARGLLIGPVYTTLASRPRCPLLSVSFRFSFKSRGRQPFPFPLPTPSFPKQHDGAGVGGHCDACRPAKRKWKREDVHLLPAKDQSLLHRRNTLFLLDFLLDLRYLYIPSSAPFYLPHSRLGVKGNGAIPDNQARCRARFPCL
jgi:hypothetical protein